MKEEKDPNGKSAHEPGSKLDAGKRQPIKGILQYFPRALLAVSEVSEKGAAKYAWEGWQTVPNGVDRYSEAMGRHLIAESFEEIDDIKKGGTGCLHAAQVAWNALARLELMLREKENELRTT